MVKNARDIFLEIVANNRKSGTKGIYSVCSANAAVLEACFQQAREDESILGVLAVLGYLRDTCIEYGLEKGVAVIKEKSASVDETCNQFDVSVQALIDQLAERFAVFSEEPCPFLEGNALGAVTAVVDDMAGGLVGNTPLRLYPVRFVYRVLL